MIAGIIFVQRAGNVAPRDEGERVDIRYEDPEGEKIEELVIADAHAVVRLGTFTKKIIIHQEDIQGCVDEISNL